MRWSAFLFLTLSACAAEMPKAYLSEPGQALSPGSQSTLPGDTAASILKEAGVTGRDGLKDAARLDQWLADNFQSKPAGGEFIGKQTAEKLLASRVMTGCHDWALMLSTLLRYAGYPAVMVDTAGRQWMADARAGRPTSEFDGHVFVEIYFGGRWVLLDSTSPRYLDGYDPANRFIPMEVGNQRSYVVMFKGTDPAGYGLEPDGFLGKFMTRFAKETDPAAIPAANGRVADLPRAGASLRPFSDEDLDKPTQPDPSRKGVVIQLEKAALDVHVAKIDGRYVATTYPYGRVFGKAIKTSAFPTLGELKAFLHGLED